MKNLLMLGALVLFSVAGSAQAMECQEGQLATVAVPFRSTNSSNRVKLMEVGTLIQFDFINPIGGRYIVDFAVVRGTGVLPIVNPQTNDVTGCTVQTKRVENHHLCIGPMGYCADPSAPKKLVLLECELALNQ